MPASPDRSQPAGPDSRSGEALRVALERQLGASPAEGTQRLPPPIPDHRLLSRIGRGAYGEVWLAHNALGTLRAVKVVYRAHFKEDRPYEREIHGILKYEPVSRTHEGLVQVLHVGRNDQAGCFYYVMELADPVPSSEFRVSSSAIAVDGDPRPTRNPGSGAYAPRTLRADLARRQRLPPADAAQLVLRLASALGHLHAHGLVHRDIKPSNVIFVGGEPKLADIGLVTDVGSSQSFVGTEGFIPPEGPGTPQADIYGLGKLLYELASGRDRLDFPQLPPGVARLPDGESLLELNEVMTRACAPEPKQRYARATELQADLNLFLAGHSLRYARTVERTLARFKRFAVAACAGLVLAAGALWLVKSQEHRAHEQARLATDRARMEAALRQRAEAAERATEQQLYTALLEQARATVRSGELGHRVRAMEALRRAGVISNTAEVRRELFAALALPDLRFERELSFAPDVTGVQLDASFERLVTSRGKGPVEIRALSDNRLLATLPASTNLPSFHREWSADGRFLAVKRDHPDGGRHADWEIWDVAPARRVLLLREVSFGALSFHPRLPRVIARSRAEGVVLWNLEDGRELVRFPLVGRSVLLRFAPQGGQFASLSPRNGGAFLSVHDATDPTSPELASHAFKDAVSAMAWHPDGRALVVPDHGGTVHWVDAGTGHPEVLGRHKWQAVRTVFSPDGAYLFTGGWERDLICWDTRTRRRAFTVSLNSDNIQFSADGRRCAVLTQTSVQLHAFERPAAHRELAEDLGVRLRQARFSPDGRWLAASADKRAGVWDLSGTAPGAVESNAYDTRLCFTPDGSELFASRSTQGDTACFRWKVAAATNPASPPQLTRLPLRRPEGFASLDLASNAVVLVSSNGTQWLPRDQIDAGLAHWSSTISGINGVAPDGRWLGIYRPFATSLQVYRLPGLEPVARLSHPASFGDFQFSPSGDEVALTSSRAGAEFWDTTTWERTRALTNVVRVLYTPDARALWLTKDQRTAGLYEARTLEPLLLLPTGMLPLALSPDGRRVAVSVDAQRLQVWDLAALREEFRKLGLDWASGDL